MRHWNSQIESARQFCKFKNRIISLELSSILKTVKNNEKFKEAKYNWFWNFASRMGTGTFLKEPTQWKNTIVKIILVLLCPRAHHEADVRQVTRIIVIKLTRARQIIHLKMSTSRIVFPSKESGGHCEPEGFPLDQWTKIASDTPVGRVNLKLRGCPKNEEFLSLWGK